MSHDDANRNPTHSQRAGGEMVVLIHGLAANRFVMRPLEKRLRARGYDTRNWGYRSVWRPIERHAERFRERLEALARREDVERLHLVGHSMGSIITRYLVASDPPPKLGRVVMLAPPNQGSRVARWLNRGLGYLSPPLAQLSDRPESFVNRLAANLDVECGVIAARRDRMVRLESTHLDGQSDHAVFTAGHTSMLFYAGVAELVDRFLQTGRFTASTDTAPAANAEQFASP
ncbi:MAG: alpha/beta fold hydrolase [Pirellulaceae bacterium]